MWYCHDCGSEIETRYKPGRCPTCRSVFIGARPNPLLDDDYARVDRTLRNVASYVTQDTDAQVEIADALAALHRIGRRMRAAP